MCYIMYLEYVRDMNKPIYETPTLSLYTFKTPYKNEKLFDV